jgi:hypothetical protein
LLIELAETRLNFFEIVGEALNLRRHGVEARARVGLNVLHRLLHGADGAVELADVVAGLLDEGLHDGVILRHLGREVLLTLEQVGDVALELDDFAGDGLGGPRTDEAASDGGSEHDRTKNRDVT